MTFEFVVEQAGCASCAELVRDALSSVGTIDGIEIDEAADVASVRLSSEARPSGEDLDALLADVSVPGHAYRVRPGSLRVV